MECRPLPEVSQSGGQKERRADGPPFYITTSPFSMA